MWQYERKTNTVISIGSGESKWFYLYGFIAAIFVIEVIFILSAWLFVLRRGLRPAQL
jgi:hypothetical protein